MSIPSMFPYLDVVFVVRSFYLLSASLILAVRLLPPLRDRFLAYGARDLGETSSNSAKRNSQSSGSAAQFLDTFAMLKVPHHWFVHFYVLSVSCSLLWLQQISMKGRLFKLLAPNSDIYMSDFSLSTTWLCMLLMFVQGIRRLYECIAFSKPSSSRMWIGHYFIGLAFYAVTSVAIWIQGVTSIPNVAHDGLTSFFGRPRLQTWLGVLLFGSASFMQHDIHAYLASMRTYKVPEHWAFRYTIAPHYTAESVLYLGLSILAAPEGQIFNWTIMCTLVFVVINLGVTAGGTKEWMMNKFQEQRSQIDRRWKMLPGLW